MPNKGNTSQQRTTALKGQDSGPVKGVRHPFLGGNQLPPRPHHPAPRRRQSIASIPQRMSQDRPNTPSGERVTSPGQIQIKSRSISTVNPPALLSPLIEAPFPGESALQATNSAILAAGMQAFFPLLRKESPVNSSGTGSDSEEAECKGGIIMRSGGPKSLPPLDNPSRPRSRSMGQEPQEPIQQRERRRSYGSLNPPIYSNLTPRGQQMSSSLGSAVFPISILKNSHERIYKPGVDASPRQGRKTVKVTFRDEKKPEYISSPHPGQSLAKDSRVNNGVTAPQQDSTDSGNEEDFLPSDEETNKSTVDEDKGCYTVVHSFTPRPKLRKKLVRPPTPILLNLYDNSDDNDESSDDDEKEESTLVLKLNSLEPRIKQKGINSATSSSGSSNSSQSNHLKKPFK